MNLMRSALFNAHSTEGQPDGPIEETHKGPKKPTVLKVFDETAPHTGHIKVITLNSPNNKNAISRQLLGELRKQITHSLEELETERTLYKGKRAGVPKDATTRAIIIASEVDGVFCAGADLKERKNMTEAETQEFLHLLRRTLETLARLYIPTISAVSSIALGGGLELALATTFRVFTPATLVGLPETRLGIIPGAGGGPRLKSLLGQTRALDITLTGRRIRGDEAFRIGLCDRLCGPTLEDIKSKNIGDDVLRQSAMDGALEMAREICEGGPATTYPLMSMMKHPHTPAKEAAAYDEVLKTQDRDEALRAFAEKRKPVFQGK
ncbi:MAG: hypothetical protein LQ346_003957 [Caloplaca aetnensis]|nr:MAG: hypothetical protein LQ346_003957 [Caloplaca aetnensis]